MHRLRPWTVGLPSRECGFLFLWVGTVAEFSFPRRVIAPCVDL